MKKGTKVWWKEVTGPSLAGVTVTDEEGGDIIVAADSNMKFRPLYLAKVADLTDKEPAKPKVFAHGTVLDNPLPVELPRVVFVEKPAAVEAPAATT